MAEQHARFIEEKEAEAPSDHGANRRPEEEVVGLLRLHRTRSAPQALVGAKPAHIEPAKEKPGHVGEAVPPDRERPEMDRHRIVERERNRHQVHGSLAEHRFCALLAGRHGARQGVDAQKRAAQAANPIKAADAMNPDAARRVRQFRA